jgi:hypothetical protein
VLARRAVPSRAHDGEMQTLSRRSTFSLLLEKQGRAQTMMEKGTHTPAMRLGWQVGQFFHSICGASRIGVLPHISHLARA